MQEKKIKNHQVRVRFAPAPTGMMHLGNVRTALINFLFARQKNGIFILRIEDTDFERNFDPEAKNIIANLEWLNLNYEEGPIKGGPHQPYFQSQRTELYAEKLKELIDGGFVYRCFCTIEELDKKRQRQIALKQPPRYDRTCQKLSENEVTQKLNNNVSYIWRVKIPQEQIINFTDLARGTLEFDLKNFSDFPVTRQDGSFTFIFANCVDDIDMGMTHVFRGEDHLSNTVDQIVLYHAFQKPIPIFYHMPIICDKEGKKLSKRVFGFSLNDLKEAGYLPEAINNYLAIIGGGTFENEIQSLEELIKNLNFENIHSTGFIRYDIEKLNWINHKWISLYDPVKLSELCLPYLEKEFLNLKKINQEILMKLIKLVQTDLITLKSSVNALRFYFETPIVYKEELLKLAPQEQFDIILKIIQKNLNLIIDPIKFVDQVKKDAQEYKIKLSLVLPLIRMALTGSSKGPNIHEILQVLPIEEAQKRLENIL